MIKQLLKKRIKTKAEWHKPKRVLNPIGKTIKRKDGSSYIIQTPNYTKVMNDLMRNRNYTFQEFRDMFNDDFNIVVMEIYWQIVRLKIISSHPDQKQHLVDSILQLYEELFIRLYSIFTKGQLLNDQGIIREVESNKYPFPPTQTLFKSYGYWRAIHLFIFQKSKGIHVSRDGVEMQVTCSMLSHDHLASTRDTRTAYLEDVDLYQFITPEVKRTFYQLVTAQMTFQEEVIFDMWWRGLEYKDMSAVCSNSTVYRTMTRIFRDIEALTKLTKKQTKYIRNQHVLDLKENYK